MNALGASAVARALGCEWADVLAALGSFAGVRRRFQPIGEIDGVLVIDEALAVLDFATHADIGETGSRIQIEQLAEPLVAGSLTAPL